MDFLTRRAGARIPETVMQQILVRLAAVTMLTQLVTFVVGLVSFLRGSAANPDDPTYMLHFGLGLFTVLLTLAVHCLSFIYLLGTGRWVKEVAIAYHIPDEPLPKLTRDLKRRTFPPALFAMLVPIAAAAAGTAVQLREWRWPVHASLAVATLLVNGWAFAVEIRNVGINAGVIDDVMREVERLRAEHGLPSNEEALRREQEG
jgi:hypothetical protein